jgi:O-antigen/teichoic acid export membrane protein
MRVIKLALNKYKEEFIYTISSYTTPIITMITNLITAAFLTPSELGIIQSVLIILPYIAFLHLGVFNGLNRNIAFYKAQNNDFKVQAMINASFTVATYNLIIGGVIGIAYLIYYSLFHPSKIYFLSSILLFLNLVLNPLTIHYETNYRSAQNFKTLGKITMIENVLYGIANLLPIWIGYIGKIIANSIRVIVRFSFRCATQPLKATEKGKRQDIFELIKTGFPLLIGSYLWGIIIVSDQTLIVKYLGTESLGLYSLSIFMITAMLVIPVSLGTLLYPKASAQYGKTGNNKGLRSFYWKALSLNIIIIFPLSLLLYFTIEPLTHFFLPRYLSGVPAAKINTLTCLTLISNGPSIIIGVVKKNTPLLIVYAMSIMTIWIIGAVIPKSYISIENIAFLRFTVSIIICIFTLIYSYYLTGKDTIVE